MANSLMHFNPNHDPKTGMFTFGLRSKYKNPDGSLTEAGKAREAQRLEKKDNKWAKRNYDKLMNKAYRPIRKEMNKYVKRELNPAYAQQLRERRITRSYMNEYNRKLAELMNRNADSLVAPSGRVVKFIAKRGELGVHLALAEAGYDMSRYKRGVYGSGKIAYKKEHVNMR